MAWTQIDIDELKKAIALGASEIVLPDRQLRLRSLQEMRQTLSIIESEVNGDSVRRTRQVRFVTHKGLR